MPLAPQPFAAVNASAVNPAVTLQTDTVGVARGDGLSGPFILELGSTAFTYASMTTVVTGSPASCTVNLQGTLDGVNWTTLATSTSTSGDTQFSSGANPFGALRVHVSAVSGGTSPTLQVAVNAFASNPNPAAGGTQPVSGFVSASQGTAAGLQGAWPVQISNGTGGDGPVGVTNPSGTNATMPQLEVSTGMVSSVTTLSAVTTGTGTTVDFGSAKGRVVFDIRASGTVTAGQVTMQVSTDGTTWYAPPSGSLVNFSGATLANPYVLVTNTNGLFGVNNNGAFRYARINVSTNVTGGATVTALCTAA